MFFKKFLTFLFLILFFSLNTQANQFREKADKLGITLSGHFIDETLKNQNGKYVLPSNSWFKKNLNSDKAIFYKSGSAFGDLKKVVSVWSTTLFPSNKLFNVAKFVLNFF